MAEPHEPKNSLNPNSMINQFSNRRSFLGSLVILTATAAIGSVGNIFSPPEAFTDPSKAWKQFCEQNNGLVQPGKYDNVIAAHVPPSGQTYQKGQLMLFKKHQLLALPTFVYWGVNSKLPSDIIITFFEAKTNLNRVFTLNRFELEALLTAYMQNKKQDMVAIILQAHAITVSTGKPFIAKTIIKYGRRVNINTCLSNNKISIKKSFINQS